MRRRGFTLIEVLVAMTVTGMAVSAGYAAYATLMDQRARLEPSMDESVTAASERELLARLLRAATLSPEQAAPAFAGLDAQEDASSDDQLTFLTRARTPLDVPETIVQLLVDRDPLTPATGLVVRYQAWHQSKTTLLELDRRVTGLRLRFYSVPLGDRGWLASWVSSTLLPSAVEVTLEGADLPALLRLRLLVPIGSGG